MDKAYFRSTTEPLIMPSENTRKLDVVRSIVGEDNFSLLVEQLPGETVRIPNSAEWYCPERRNQLIRKDFYSGMGRAELERKYGLTYETLRKIINTRPE